MHASEKVQIVFQMLQRYKKKKQNLYINLSSVQHFCYINEILSQQTNNLYLQ